MTRTSRYLRAGSVALAALVLAACAGTSSPAPSVSIAPTASPIPAPTASPSPTAPPVSFSGDIAVNGTRTLRVRCIGHGSPTILLEAGGTGSNLDDWTRWFPDILGAQTTTCAYSRAGGNGSVPMPDPWTMDKVVADADALLAGLKTQAGIEGPYVLVGWSFGGAVALAEALAHPDTTVGLVILDSGFPNDFLAVCPTSGRTVAECQAIYDGDKDAKDMGAELNHRIHALPGMPIVLVSAMHPDPGCAPEPGASVVTADLDGALVSAADCVTLMVRIADAEIAAWRTLGAQVVDTRVDATHDAMIDQAGEQIAAVILAVVAKAR